MISRDGQFSPAYFEAFEEGAAAQFDEIQKKVASERTKFFEQVALLSGGAIVLSVSLLSTLFGKVVLHGIVELIVGWFALLLALLASFYRTLQYQPYMLESSVAHYTKTLASVKMARHLRAKQGDKVMSLPDEEGRSKQVSADELKQEAAELYADSKARKERSDRYIRNVQISEKIALTSFSIGVLLLTIFAGFNILKAAVQKPTTEGPPVTQASPK